MNEMKMEKKSDKVIPFLISHMKIILSAWIIVLFLLEFAACCLELCPWDYVGETEKWFTYDMDKVIPVVSILWSSVSIPMAFLMQQSQQRCYGVRMIDIMCQVWGNLGALFWFLFLLVQPSLVLIAVFHQLRILCKIVAWVLVGCLMCLFYLVGISMSREATRYIIEKQCDKIGRILEKEDAELKGAIQASGIPETEKTIEGYMERHRERLKSQRWLLDNMIKEIDYSHQESVETLKDILVKKVFSQSEGYMGCKVVYDLVQQMLKVSEKTVAYDMIEDMFFEEIRNPARKGMLYALISEYSRDAYQRVWQMEDRYEDDPDQSHRKELICCGFMWAIHQQAYCMDSEVELENRFFVYRCKPYIDAEIMNADLIWESILMLQILGESDNMNRSIDNFIHICEEWGVKWKMT